MNVNPVHQPTSLTEFKRKFSHLVGETVEGKVLYYDTSTQRGIVALLDGSLKLRFDCADKPDTKSNAQAFVKGCTIACTPTYEVHPSGTGEIVVASDISKCEVAVAQKDPARAAKSVAPVSAGAPAAVSPRTSSLVRRASAATAAVAAILSATRALPDEPETPPNELSSTGSSINANSPGFQSKMALLRYHDNYDTLQLGWGDETDLLLEAHDAGAIQHKTPQDAVDALSPGSTGQLELSEVQGEEESERLQPRPASRYHFISATESWAGRKDEQEDRFGEEVAPEFGAFGNDMHFAGICAQFCDISVLSCSE